MDKTAKRRGGMNSEKCKYCSSLNLIRVNTPPNSPHYQKLVCKDCDSFQKWLPKPENENKSQVLLEKLEALKLKNLSSWEARFVSDLISKCESSIAQKKRFGLSPRQSEVLDNLLIMYGVSDGAQEAINPIDDKPTWNQLNLF